MDSSQNEPDFSWMSFNPEAHGITPRLSLWPGAATSSRSERTQQDQQQMAYAGRGVWPSKSWSFDERDSSRPRYDLREEEIVEEQQNDEEWSSRIRKQQLQQAGTSGEKFEDGGESAKGPSSSPSKSSAARPFKFTWDVKSRPHIASVRSLDRGLRRQRKNWMQSMDDEADVKSTEISRRNVTLGSRLQFAAKVFSGSFLVLVISIFLLYILLSFGASARPHSDCELGNVVLDYSTQRIRLRGGRHVSFREQGVGANKARRTLLIVHDLLSSRLAGIPGISASLLKEFGVRLISYDRPGYGQSDPHLGRSYASSAQDMSDIADTLKVGEKFWVAGFGSGGPHVWAAVKFIPERLAGVALFAPAGNFFAENLTGDETAQTWGILTLRQKWMYIIARHFPALLPSLMQKTLINDSPTPTQIMGVTLGLKDQARMQLERIHRLWKDDVLEALHQRCAFPMTEELIMLVNDWGFSLANLPFSAQEAKGFLQHVAGIFQTKEPARIFSGPIHIWQGSDDQLVPLAINKYAERMIYKNKLPNEMNSLINFHVLEGEGHWSWFWFCDECHRFIFTSLFQSEEGSQDVFLSQGFMKEESDAVQKAFGSQREFLQTANTRKTVKDGDNIHNPSHPLIMETEKDETLDRQTDLEEDTSSTGMTLYVPESCQVPLDMTTSIFKAIEERVRKYIR